MYWTMAAHWRRGVAGDRFCLDKLRSEMRAGFGLVERRLDRHEEILGEVLREVRSLKPDER